MKKINDYLIMIIGNYLEIHDVIALSQTSKRWYKIFKDYFEYYKRECKSMFTEEWRSNNSNYSNYSNNSKFSTPTFLCKGTATRIWKDLIRDGVTIKKKWRNFETGMDWLDNQLFVCLGHTLTETLKSPDLTVPALIKEDKNVDFHSVYSQYLYEYMFRMKSICKGRKPTTIFTFLSETEAMIKEAFTHTLSSVDQMTEEIKANDETQIFMSLRWYCDAIQQAQNLGESPEEKWSDKNDNASATRFMNQFNSYYISDSEGSTCSSTQFKNHIWDLLKVQEMKSNLNSIMTLIYESVTFHCKLTNEIINEIQDEMLFLQEYDKYWNAYVASMIKIDEILTPLSRIINKVYKRLYPEYPCFPQFSFLRLFVIIWKKEVFQFCKESIEDDIVRIFRKFHKSCLNYSKQQKAVRQNKKKKTSLSDYFTRSVGKSSGSGGIHSMVSPMLSTIKLNPNETKNSNNDIIMIDQEEECNSVIDMEMFYGEEDPNSLSFDKQDKEAVKQILADIMDISMHEYSMHYVWHSENEYLTPFRDLKSKIKDEILRFYKFTKNIPYKLWSEIASEHTRVLSNFLPVPLLKEIYDFRFYFAKKYTKHRIKSQLKGYNKEQKLKKNQKSDQMQVFNTNSGSNDPSILTQTEYLEIVVKDYLNTPFHEFLVSCLKSDKNKNKVLSFMAYVKENELDIINIYNENYEVNRKFTAEVEFKNSTIRKYKEQRGFPLKLADWNRKLYAIEDGITRVQLEEIKTQKQYEKEQKQQLKKADQEFTEKFGFESDSLDDTKPSTVDGQHKNILKGMRCSNPEKRMKPFGQIWSESLIKSLIQKDVNMDEEAKSDLNEETKHIDLPKFGKIGHVFENKSKFGKAPFDSWSFAQENDSETSMPKLQRNSNCIARSLTSKMIRFSDLEKIDDDVEMDDINAISLTFKKS